jgi:hypothetical protein
VAEPIIEIHYLDGRIESNPTNLSGVQQAISSDLESVEINGVPFSVDPLPAEGSSFANCRVSDERAACGPIPPAGVEPAHMV